MHKGYTVHEIEYYTMYNIIKVGSSIVQKMILVDSAADWISIAKGEMFILYICPLWTIASSPQSILDLCIGTHLARVHENKIYYCLRDLQYLADARIVDCVPYIHTC